MVRPIGDKILVEFVKKNETSSGIILPDRKTKIEEDIAKVVAIGTDTDIIVRPGDTIVFNPHAAVIATIEGKEYILLTQKAIICVTNWAENRPETNA